jgi:PAS domain S-box-containing protein
LLARSVHDMDWLATLSPIWLVFSTVPTLFAAYFGYMFYRDRDKRKLMFVLAFSFASISLIEKILPSTAVIIFERLYSLGGIPLMSAVLITVFGGLHNYENFDTPFKVFVAAFIATAVTIFLPFDNSLLIIISTMALSILTLGISVYVWLKKRKIGDLLFFLSLVAFSLAGFGQTLDLGLAFYFLGQIFAYIFIALVFSLATYDAEWSNASFFKVQQKLTEIKKDLKELETKYKIIFETASDAIFVVEAETGIIVDCNLEATKLVGREKSEIIGKNRNFLHPRADDDGENSETLDAQELLNFEGKTGVVETKVIQKSGEVLDVAIKVGTFEFAGKKLVVGLFRDVTQQKLTQNDLTLALESISYHMEKTQALNDKLRVVGSLTRHDVRNKLSTVTGYAYLLKKKHFNEADIVDGLGKMEQAVKDTVKILEFAKLYEQLGDEELTYINVEEKLNEAIVLFSGSIPMIRNECLGLLLLADSFLRQLFYNFVDNTIKYGKKTTTIRVYFEKADQDSLQLIYEDDGDGISAENKLRLFSEGFSTGGSTGFGLFLSKKMIDVYGWTIIEDGELGKGVKFTITIPKLNKSGKENYQTV